MWGNGKPFFVTFIAALRRMGELSFRFPIGALEAEAKRTSIRDVHRAGEAELTAALRRLFAATVDVRYQSFRETALMTLARRLHLRRAIGLHNLYADLTRGEPHALSNLVLSRKSEGLPIGLVIIANGKKG